MCYLGKDILLVLLLSEVCEKGKLFVNFQSPSEIEFFHVSDFNFQGSSSTPTNVPIGDHDVHDPFIDHSRLFSQQKCPSKLSLIILVRLCE